MRSGSVAIIGRTNVGKSTFLNAALDVDLAIVSPLPQTTRDELLGIVHRPDVEIAFIDTPGLHRPKTELGRRMNSAALGSLRSNDLVLFMTDTSMLTRRSKRSFLPDSDCLDPDDRLLLKALPATQPSVLVINKVDLVRDKSRLLPLIAAFDAAHPFRAILPVSLRRDDGVELILSELTKALPEREHRFDDDTLTDRPLSFFAREYIREQVLQRTSREVPHAVAVSIESFVQKPSLTLISATIHVEKTGQASILVGRGGQSIKAIGTGARERLEELIGTKVHLELFVRVSDRWKDAPRQLSELGYDQGKGRDLTNLLGRKKHAAGPPKVKPQAAKAEGSTKSTKAEGGTKPAKAHSNAKPAKAEGSAKSKAHSNAKPSAAKAGPPAAQQRPRTGKASKKKKTTLPGGRKNIPRGKR